MTEQLSLIEKKSAARLAFEHYLRTGRRLSSQTLHSHLERKFNPYHDPRNGQFTFAPGGPQSLRDVIYSDPRGLHRARQGDAWKILPGGPSADGLTSGARAAREGSATPLQLAQYRPNPRARIGGNGGPPLNDPMTLQRVFPGLSNAPGGSLLVVADNLLDLTGPGTRLTTELTTLEANRLIKQIQAIDPNYSHDSLGFPTTPEGQARLINELRLDRAAAYYRIRGEVRPLQVEVLRHLQESTDAAYQDAVRKYDNGSLKARLSREEAIGNYVDRKVRKDLKELYNRLGIPLSRDGPIRIIGREYITSGTDRSYRIPDARVGNIAFDVSLTRKTLRTPQVRGFFNSDWNPDIVIIVRPSQLGPNSTYAITRPGL